MNDSRVNLQHEILHITTLCRHIVDQDELVARTNDSMQSLVRRRRLVEADIARLETEAAASDEILQRLLRERSQVDLLTGHKCLLAQLRVSADWLAQRYPETANMTIHQLLDFIDAKKSEMRAQHATLRRHVREKSRVVGKYNNLVKRRDHLQQRIDDLERVFISQMEESAKIKKETQLVETLINMRSRLS